MIISDKYKFVFFHPPKVGGTSITIALEPYSNKNMRTPELRAAFFKTVQLRTHMPYCDIAAEWKQRFKDYFKFTFVRNPYHRLVSYYLWCRRRPGNLHHELCQGTLWEFLQEHFPRKQYDFKEGMNFVGNYESLQADFDQVCQTIGLPQTTLPHTKNSRVDNYNQFLCENAKFVIDQFYHNDFVELGYLKALDR